jgi:hypothetical protein
LPVRAEGDVPIEEEPKFPGGELGFATRIYYDEFIRQGIPPRIAERMAYEKYTEEERKRAVQRSTAQRAAYPHVRFDPVTQQFVEIPKTGGEMEPIGPGGPPVLRPEQPADERKAIARLRGDPQFEQAWREIVEYYKDAKNLASLMVPEAGAEFAVGTAEEEAARFTRESAALQYVIQRVEQEKRRMRQRVRPKGGGKLPKGWIPAQ